MKVAKVASAAAEGMVSSLRITKPRIPWLFFEGVELAAKQVRNGEQWSCWGDPRFEQPQDGGIYWADFGSHIHCFWCFLSFPFILRTTFWLACIGRFLSFFEDFLFRCFTPWAGLSERAEWAMLRSGQRCGEALSCAGGGACVEVHGMHKFEGSLSRSVPLESLRYIAWYVYLHIKKPFILDSRIYESYTCIQKPIDRPVSIFGTPPHLQALCFLINHSWFWVPKNGGNVVGVKRFATCWLLNFRDASRCNWISSFIVGRHFAWFKQCQLKGSSERILLHCWS